MPQGQKGARGLGRPLRAVLDSIADPDGDVAVPALSLGEAAAPPALGDALTLVLTADPTVVAGWASGTDIGVAGAIAGREDAVWALVDDLAALRDSGRPVLARDDGRWGSFVVTAGERGAIGIVGRAGALAPETCALLHALAAQLWRRSR